MKRVALTIALTALVASAGAARAQDAAAGEHVFIKCRACHMIGEGARNMVGPSLNGIVGRPAGTFPGYSYSDANKSSGFTWDEADSQGISEEPARQGARHQDGLRRQYPTQSLFRVTLRARCHLLRRALNHDLPGCSSGFDFAESEARAWVQ